MEKFSDYTLDLLVEKESNFSQINGIFSYIEYLLVNGEEDVKNGVTTCFLENILNITPEKIHPKRFVQYLAPHREDIVALGTNLQEFKQKVCK